MNFFFSALLLLLVVDFNLTLLQIDVEKLEMICWNERERDKQ